jgi:hypothetical protein
VRPTTAHKSIRMTRYVPCSHGGESVPGPGSHCRLPVKDHNLPARPRGFVPTSCCARPVEVTVGPVQDRGAAVADLGTKASPLQSIPAKQKFYVPLHLSIPLCITLLLWVSGPAGAGRWKQPHKIGETDSTTKFSQPRPQPLVKYLFYSGS